ncbi:MAG: AbrB/MazE/SpoVT family DNA-binding domain-containing protein [SAR202 cluster bacterium]|nr:AbrB/MazE/SpoVT family DNA-binding domain-containing protein [SAR202 cluster bacterium]
MKEMKTRITQKGQVTIPAEIRSRLGLKPRDTVRFTMEGDIVTLAAAKSRLLEGFGAVKPHKRPEDWRKIREETERAIAEDVIREDVES